MNRPDDPNYHNKEAYKKLFPNHVCGEQVDEDCGRCIQKNKEKGIETPITFYPTTFAKGQYIGDE